MPALRSPVSGGERSGSTEGRQAVQTGRRSRRTHARVVYPQGQRDKALDMVRSDDLSQIAIDSLRERICVLDRRGAIVLTNRSWDAFAHSSGGDPRRCGRGANYLEVCRTAVGRYSEGASEAGDAIDRVVRGVTPHITLDYQCPLPARTAWFRLSAGFVPEFQGGAVVSHSDITERAMLAEKLRCAQTNYAALVESPVDAATVVTADGMIHYQSPGSDTVLGYHPAELAGHAIFEFIHPEDSSSFSRLLHECLGEPRGWHRAEIRFRTRSGSWRILESIAHKALSGPESRIVINSRDVTEQRQAENALRERQSALRRRREDLEWLVARLFRQQEEERQRTAEALHRHLGQRLAEMTLQTAHPASYPADAARHLCALRESVTMLGDELRRMADGLRPTMLDHLGLAVALRTYCEAFTLRHKIQIRYFHRGVPSRLNRPTASALYRVAQEALSNVIRHADTDHAWVTLSRTGPHVRLSIRDAGAGFDPARLEPGSALGVLSMRERMRAVDGSLIIHSQPGAGAEVVALAPLASLSTTP